MFSNKVLQLLETRQSSSCRKCIWICMILWLYTKSLDKKEVGQKLQVVMNWAFFIFSQKMSFCVSTKEIYQFFNRFNLACSLRNKYFHVTIHFQKWFLKHSIQFSGPYIYRTATEKKLLVFFENGRINCSLNKPFFKIFCDSLFRYVQLFIPLI